MIVISLTFGISGDAITIAVICLALNLVASSLFITAVKRLARGDPALPPRPSGDAISADAADAADAAQPVARHLTAAELARANASWFRCKPPGGRPPLPVTLPGSPQDVGASEPPRTLTAPHCV